MTCCCLWTRGMSDGHTIMGPIVVFPCAHGASSHNALCSQKPMEPPNNPLAWVGSQSMMMVRLVIQPMAGWVSEVPREGSDQISLRDHVGPAQSCLALAHKLKESPNSETRLTSFLSFKGHQFSKGTLFWMSKWIEKREILSSSLLEMTWRDREGFGGSWHVWCI